MTQVLLEKKSGFLACSAKGHADFAKKGFDIACAAVTVLMRTAMQTLQNTAGIAFESSVSIEKRGELQFAARVEEGLDAEEKSAVKIKIEFLAEYLKNGFESLSKEFPQNIEYREN